jgi:hypothetical protein
MSHDTLHERTPTGLLDLPIGEEPAVTGDGHHLTVHRLGRTSTTGGFDLPGEFDLPPEEPVQLVGEVPWELAEAED